MNRKAKASEFVDSDYEIKITGRHIEITDSMKDYAMDKMARVERLMNRIIDVNIIMDTQKLDHTVEIIIKAGNLKVTSQASSTDMYASIDKAFAKLEAQLRRYKSKLQDHHAKGHSVLDMSVDVFQKPNESDAYSNEESEDFVDDEDTFVPHVIAQDSMQLKTLTFDEAIMKMELSNEHFMVFKNETDHKLKVIYRREDGNYGIVEPLY